MIYFSTDSSLSGNGNSPLNAPPLEQQMTRQNLEDLRSLLDSLLRQKEILASLSGVHNMTLQPLLLTLNTIKNLQTCPFTLKQKIDIVLSIIS